MPFKPDDLLVHDAAPDIGLYQFIDRIDDRLIRVKAFGQETGRMCYWLFSKSYRLATETEIAAYVANRIQGGPNFIFLDGPEQPKPTSDNKSKI